MELFDSHAHYNDEHFKDDLDKIITDNYNKGIKYTVVNGYNVESSKVAIELANKYDCLYATVGISPNDITDTWQDDLKEIEKLAQNPKVVAIGEIGMDLYWNKVNKEDQKALFIEQIKIANKLNLPITIHNRDAHVDVIDILTNVMPCNNKGIFHCCPLNVELIKEGLKLGFYISFSGVVTFKNAKPDLAVNEVPLNRILIETDSPYLSPEPNRGKRNDPSNVEYVARRIAEIKKVSFEELSKFTLENAKKVYNIKK